ncbi:MAG: hypothetical protein A2X58_08385 [Nitrospirae bacterium GWC2_56_14]|nr:MAG: hypothetical protein A2X58_08385 [Nitrospirae bacterium GWC2_56_14]
MFSPPSRQEIDHRAMKLIIGLIALTLANITSIFSHTLITSISAAYYEDGWARNFLVGFLFAISSFLLAYNGESRKEMFLSKLAAAAAFGVAMFPCGCDGHVELIPHVHYICAAVLFSILVAFCWIFHKRALQKGHREALRRSKLYLLCGAIIVLAMLVMFIDFITHEALSAVVARLTFYCERAGLVAFGVSWLTASRVLPVISSKKERFAPFA